MPNVNDLNQFLSSSDVSDGDKVVFADAGVFVERDYSKNKDGSDKRIKLQITLNLPDGKQKLYTMNNTSQKNIVEKYGPHSEDWVGKTATVELIKQNVGGMIKTIVYLK